MMNDNCSIYTLLKTTAGSGKPKAHHCPPIVLLLPLLSLLALAAGVSEHRATHHRDGEPDLGHQLGVPRRVVGTLGLHPRGAGVLRALLGRLRLHALQVLLEVLLLALGHKASLEESTIFPSILT